MTAREFVEAAILSHAGGFVPYASHRFAELARVFRRDAAKPADILASFQRFYFDTALSSSSAALPSLEVFAEEGHILFGTDFPFAPASVSSSFIRKFDGYEVVPEERAAINRGNALALFERLRVKKGDFAAAATGVRRRTAASES